MEEKDNKNEKDLAIEEKRIEDIVEKINIAMLNGKEEVVLEDGSSYVKINILESTEKGTYDIEFGGKKIATVKKGEKVSSDKIKSEMLKYRKSFALNDIDSKIGRTTTAQEKSDSQSLKLEAALVKAKKEGRADKLRVGREITAAGEDLSLLMKRMFGRGAHEIYRVRDENDSHKFTYICKGNDGKYFEPKGSRSNEGTNARQMCWIQNTDGSFEKKTVDDMKVFGKYVIATDINTVTDSTRTLVGQRTPRGEYILMSALDHRIADTSSNANVKDNLARGNSIWEIEDVILAAELGRTIREIRQDGKLSADEVEIIKKLKKEGIADEKVRRIIMSMSADGELNDKGLNDASIKAILDTVESTAEQIEELKKEDFSDNEIKDVMELVHREKVDFEDAKEKISKERDEYEDQKVRGIRDEGPWASRKH